MVAIDIRINLDVGYGIITTLLPKGARVSRPYISMMGFIGECNRPIIYEVKNNKSARFLI